MGKGDKTGTHFKNVCEVKLFHLAFSIKGTNMERGSIVVPATEVITKSN